MKKIIIIFVLALLLIIAQFKINILKDVKVLFLTNYNHITTSLTNVISNLKSKKELQKKIKDYENILDSYESIFSQNEILTKENKKLKELLNIEYEEYTIKWANIIIREEWYNKITIDKGKKNGIKTGMAVINNQGFVGIVEQVSEYSSEITLLTNKKIAVMISSEGGFNYGVIENYQNNYYQITGVDGLFNVNEGDYVISTNLNTNIPDSILIGTVESITYDNFGLSKILKVKSSVDFNDLSVVGVLLKWLL